MRNVGKRSPDQKLRIWLEELFGTVEILELSRHEGLHLAQFYQWKKLLESGVGRVFESETMNPSARETRPQAELTRGEGGDSGNHLGKCGVKKGL